MNAQSEQTDRYPGLHVGLLFMIVGLLAVGMLSYVFMLRVHDWYTWEQIQRHGTSAQGTLIELFNRPGMRRIAHYEYRVRDRSQAMHTYRRSEQLSVPMYHQLDAARFRHGAQTPVVVHYLADNPAIARLARQESTGEMAAMTAAAICSIPVFSLFLLGGATALVHGIQRAPLDDRQSRAILIGIGIVIVLIFVQILLPPSESAMMDGLEWVGP